jgi:leucyl/phenylalanyl-tRNA--protein transferase
MSSPHLTSLGAIEVPREDFLERLRDAVALPGRPGRWRFDLDVPQAAAHLPMPVMGR